MASKDGLAFAERVLLLEDFAHEYPRPGVTYATGGDEGNRPLLQVKRLIYQRVPSPVGCTVLDSLRDRGRSLRGIQNESFEDVGVFAVGAVRGNSPQRPTPRSC